MIIISVTVHVQENIPYSSNKKASVEFMHHLVSLHRGGGGGQSQTFQGRSNIGLSPQGWGVISGRGAAPYQQLGHFLPWLTPICFLDLEIKWKFDIRTTVKFPFRWNNAKTIWIQLVLCDLYICHTESLENTQTGSITPNVSKIDPIQKNGLHAN